jgi:hypothetical protein
MPPRSANKAFSRPSTVALNALALESLAWVDLMFRSVSVILGRLELRQDGRASGRFDLDRLPVEQCDEVVDDVGVFVMSQERLRPSGGVRAARGGRLVLNTLLADPSQKRPSFELGSTR